MSKDNELDFSMLEDTDQEDLDFSMMDDDEISVEEGEGVMPEDFAVKDEDKISQLGALATGISEGATLGADRPLGGLAAAALASKEDEVPFEDIAAGIQDLMTGGTEGRESIRQRYEAEKMMKDLGIEEKKPTKDLLEEYKKGKAGVKARAEEAVEEFPATTLAGGVLGGIASGTALAGPQLGASVAKVKRLKDTAEKAKLLGKLKTSKKLGSEAFKESLKFAAKEGAKAGAITGATMGESEDITGTIADIAKGAGIGAVSAAALPAVSEGTGKLISKIPGVQDALESFSLGLSGKSIESEDVRDEITKTARKYIRDFQSRLDALGAKKGELDDVVNELGITINTKDDLAEARSVVNNIDSKVIRKKAAKFLDVIEDYMGESKEHKKAAELLRKKLATKSMRDPIAEARAKLDKKTMKKTLEQREVPSVSKESNIFSSDLEADLPKDRESLVRLDDIEKPGPFGVEKTKRVMAEDITPFKPEMMPEEEKLGYTLQKYKDLSTGKVESTATKLDDLSRINPEELTIDQAQDLLGTLNEEFTVIGDAGDKIPAKVRRSATELAKNLRSKINEAYQEVGEKTGTDIADINKKFTKYLEAKKLGGIGDKAITELDKDMELKHLAKFIEGQSDQDVVTNLDLFLKRIRQADSDMFDKYGKEIAELRKMADLSKGEQALQSGSKVGALFGGLSGFANRVSNLVGRMASSPTRGATTAIRTSKARIARGAKDFIESAPESIQSLVAKSQEIRGGSNFTSQLEKAAVETETKRRAILFGLYSNPAFRKMFNLDGDTEK